MSVVRTAAGLRAALVSETLLLGGEGHLPEPSGIATDSRRVEAGSWFVAVRGSQEDGHRYLADAVRAGAGALIVEQPTPSTLPTLVVRDGRLAALRLARAWFGDPGRTLSLTGVTGTSGKTTTVLLIRHLFNAGQTAGSIGTLGAFDGHDRAVPSTAGSLTTPGPVDLLATLAALVERGVERVAMETSSHSLDQGRLEGLAFAAAVFTNLSREHLDYHPSMDAYRLAKLRLMGLLAPGGIAAVNADDPAWDDIPAGSGVLRFGTAATADVRAEGIVLDAVTSRFRLAGRFGVREATIPLPGHFNVMNALGAAAAVLGAGLPVDDVVERLASAPQVPGRMERLLETPCVVIRDYAHKPDALERVLRTLRPITAGRLVVLFGCGGDRDRGKRPIMGRIAAELADLVVLTSDNPRTESPERILDDVAVGIPQGSRVERIADRRQAIRWALGQARQGDTLVLAGKGHETYQIVGTEYLPFDERDIVADAAGGS